MSGDGVASPSPSSPGLLRGRRILLTRPQPELDETAQRVAALGGIPLLAPAMVIAPPQEEAPLRHGLQTLADWDGILFTSVNAVRAVERFPLPDVKPLAYAVGGKTAQSLEAAGWRTAPLPPGVRDGASLAEAMIAAGGKQGVAGRRYFFPRAEEGREELAERLRQAGAKVELVIAYRAVASHAIPEEAAARLCAGEVDGALFFSPRTVALFLALLTPPMRQGLARAVLGALSSAVAAALAGGGFPGAVVPDRPEAEALLDRVGVRLLEGSAVE
ncbi:MAG: uroporphyrinogen-III synthase [Magnetococcales bacterium]|nr:uroporphyrinogen-III synthase [Magnetococcales bacterium]